MGTSQVHGELHPQQSMTIVLDTPLPQSLEEDSSTVPALYDTILVYAKNARIHTDELEIQLLTELVSIS